MDILNRNYKNLLAQVHTRWKKINFAEKSALLEEILNTKLKGKLLLDFQTRNIRNFEQLKRELEMDYLGKRGHSCNSNSMH